ncbi:unnamed protein product [Orchesella dallaii]|uniref:Uncharacterized protein n=1 Tax=Orchesella dallaii TaxID=48710 RepID=A0ABP1RZS9_9HEXA
MEPPHNGDGPPNTVPSILYLTRGQSNNTLNKNDGTERKDSEPEIIDICDSEDDSKMEIPNGGTDLAARSKSIAFLLSKQNVVMTRSKSKLLNMSPCANAHQPVAFKSNYSDERIKANSRKVGQLPTEIQKPTRVPDQIFFEPDNSMNNAGMADSVTAKSISDSYLIPISCNSHQLLTDVFGTNVGGASENRLPEYSLTFQKLPSYNQCTSSYLPIPDEMSHKSLATDIEESNESEVKFNLEPPYGGSSQLAVNGPVEPHSSTAKLSCSELRQNSYCMSQPEGLAAYPPTYTSQSYFEEPLPSTSSYLRKALNNSTYTEYPHLHNHLTESFKISPATLHPLDLSVQIPQVSLESGTSQKQDVDQNREHCGSSNIQAQSSSPPHETPFDYSGFYSTTHQYMSPPSNRLTHPTVTLPVAHQMNNMHLSPSVNAVVQEFVLQTQSKRKHAETSNTVSQARTRKQQAPSKRRRKSPLPRRQFIQRLDFRI